MLCCILGVFVVVASDTTQTYHVAIVGYLSCGLVLTASSVNSLIYTNDKAREATAAGHILLSMVNVCVDTSDLMQYWLTESRLYGSSTLDQRPQPFPELTSTRSRFTRIIDNRVEACLHMVVGVLILPSLPMFLHKCTLLLNSVASRLRRPLAEATTTVNPHPSLVAIFLQYRTT